MINNVNYSELASELEKFFPFGSKGKSQVETVMVAQQIKQLEFSMGNSKPVKPRNMLLPKTVARRQPKMSPSPFNRSIRLDGSSPVAQVRPFVSTNKRLSIFELKEFQPETSTATPIIEPMIPDSPTA